jgi:hypothetical protein
LQSHLLIVAQFHEVKEDRNESYNCIKIFWFLISTNNALLKVLPTFVADCHAIVVEKRLKQLMKLGKNTNDKVQRLTVRLSSQLMQKIEELAHTKRLTLSQLLREAVQSYIAAIE